MGKLVALPYYREDYPRTLQYRRRPLNGETLLFVATMPIMVVRDRYQANRRQTVTIDATILQGDPARHYRSYTNPHEAIRRPLILHLEANEHAPGGNWNRLDADAARTLARRYSTERLIPSAQIGEMLTIAARWNDNNWHNGCAHQDRARWGKSPRYLIRKSQTAATAGWDRTPALGPYFEMKTTGQLYASEGGCLAKPCRACGYRYGTAHLCESLPADIMATIRAWFPEVAPLAEAQPVETYPDPLDYPKPEAPDLSWLPVAPPPLVATVEGHNLFWKTPDGDRWAKFGIDTRRRAIYGLNLGYAGQESSHCLHTWQDTPDSAAEYARLAIGWLS
jgi:hypothetical protein